MASKVRARFRERASYHKASFFTAYRGSKLAMLATKSLGGRTHPVAMVELDLPAALNKLIELLTVPIEQPEDSLWGVEGRRVRFFTQSKDWTPTQERRKTDNMRLAPIGDVSIPEEVAAEMDYCLGARIYTSEGDSVDDFVARFAERLKEKDDEKHLASIAAQREVYEEIRDVILGVNGRLDLGRR